jgi:hypothetical protein
MRINSRNNLTQISDGSSNTIIVGEQPSDAAASKRGSQCGHDNHLRQRGDSFESGRNNLPQITDGTSNTIFVGESRSRGESENNLRQPGNQRRSGGNNLKQPGSEFNGREAAKQIQDGTSNTILLPETPIRVKTKKECK